MEKWNNGKMERLSKLVCKNLMSRLWEGLWERIIMERRNIDRGFKQKLHYKTENELIQHSSIPIFQHSNIPVLQENNALS